jgi:hypothetical protein
MANETTQNAATLGLGFHRFDGNVNVKDVIHEIGADFTVREDKLVRLPAHLFDHMMEGQPIRIDPKYVIQTHKATVHDGFDDTIGIVGNDYGTIQNNAAFDILDLMCNASVTDTPMKIVSAGLVNNYDPYIQAELPMDARIDGDKSETKFYVFAHTSHDGTSALQLRFSPVRVICRNTYMANVSSKLGLNFKHSRYAAQRVDLTKEVNIEKIRERVARLNFLSQEYIDKMNSFRLAKVTDKDINEYINALFVDDKLQDLVREHNYNFDIEDISTRTKNVIETFKNVLNSDDKGQDFARGTKLWLFNGITNFTSNFASYGSKKDTDEVRATKRFNSMLNGTANKRVEKALELLAA